MPANILFYVKEGANPDLTAYCEELLQVSPIYELPEDIGDTLVLQADREGLALVKNGRDYRCDFTKNLPRTAPNNLNGELLIKATRFRNSSGALLAVDATAGLGEDSFLLAAAGFQVILFEKDPVIALLLHDALQRGRENSDLAPILSRMELRTEDSVNAMKKLDISPDIVLLDPMFPQRQKSSLIKKKFQLLHLLESPCNNEEELLSAAMACDPKRIVIKRPAKGAYLADKKPSYSIKGDSIRYDCIVCRS